MRNWRDQPELLHGSRPFTTGLPRGTVPVAASILAFLSSPCIPQLGAQPGASGRTALTHPASAGKSLPMPDQTSPLNAPTRDGQLAADRARRGEQSPRTREVNCHVHTTYSFSPYSPAFAAERADAAGLLAVGIRDHDSVAGATEMPEAAYPAADQDCRYFFPASRSARQFDRDAVVQQPVGLVGGHRPGDDPVAGLVERIRAARGRGHSIGACLHRETDLPVLGQDEGPCRGTTTMESGMRLRAASASAASSPRARRPPAWPRAGSSGP